ncbi:MAG: putative paraquat-inducible protein [Herbinix sp.]|jgi:enoyl-[acyl-carrier protein] reductase/trans-2-enoyl-CoA reductase (NAD+)|nr:putative paraquat-inducible protein [Herbinix sp.]
MIISPKFKGYICTTAHPEGCANNVSDQINYVKNHAFIKGPNNVLVIGASAGYGLASRIVSTFGAGANTIGIVFEKPASNNRTATAGWYNTAAFEQKAADAGYYAKTINGDAFSNKIKEETLELIRNDLGKIDLIIYSIAAPRRTDPVTGETYSSALKPIGNSFVSKTVDINNNSISGVEICPATEEEIRQTMKVMGGEDWVLWMKTLSEAGVLSDGVKTVAYTYIGSDITEPIYRNGTIGKAKEHLEKSTVDINEILKPWNGKAYVASNKALVTQSSSAIPVVTLYIALLLKIMKENNTDETCIEQIYRLFADKMYHEQPSEDSLIRMDEFELSDEVQNKIKDVWDSLNSENVTELTDIVRFKYEFLKLFGFGHPKVNYEVDADQLIAIPSVPMAND